MTYVLHVDLPSFILFPRDRTRFYKYIFCFDIDALYFYELIFQVQLNVIIKSL